ncbi:uncharacterized protein LOC116163753 [Photinus pyralis]|uniref:uncharacterized protein LOC116163753 n=1 Tax=Photinus pyralis TaxID=7054 RepID=UPI00126726E3|nr:uncharacterized protein LOC116163753 [Photinus pyralis]
MSDADERYGTPMAGRPRLMRSPVLSVSRKEGSGAEELSVRPGANSRMDEVVPETPYGATIQRGRRTESRKRNDSSSTEEEVWEEKSRPKKLRRRTDEGEDTVLVSPKSAVSDLGDIRKLQTEETLMGGETRLAIDEAIQFIRASTNTHTKLKETIRKIDARFRALENHRALIERKWSAYVRALKVAAVQGKTAVVMMPQMKVAAQGTTRPIKATQDIEVQTSPRATYAEATAAPTAGSSGMAKSKRVEIRETMTESEEEKTTKAVREINKARQRRSKLVNRASTGGDSEETGTERDWTLVEKKRKGKSKPRGSDSEGTSSAAAASIRRRPRSEAVLIKLKGGNGMEDILRRVRQVDMTGVDTKIVGITKTRTGDILLRVEWGVGKVTPVHNTIKAAITDRDVMLLEENCKIAIRDLDAVTTKEEVLEAIMRAAPEARCRVKDMVQTDRGQMAAYVFVDRVTAEEVVKRGYLRVGLTSCRVRIVTELVRCLRCWEVGHLAAKCQGADRSRMCFKCGGEGHQARECTGADACFVCEKAEPGSGKGHRAYTKACRRDGQKVTGTNGEGESEQGKDSQQKDDESAAN